MGSSPRTWGRRLPELRAVLDWRFIPTHVGQTQGRRNFRCRAAVHPHARGADRSRRDGVRAEGGSSPRTWGRRNPVTGIGRGTRFIPTHVGQTGRLRASRLRRAVHPHARGADRFAAVVCGHHVGSSPRTWGRRNSSRQTPRPRRFIPTHVGQTQIEARIAAEKDGSSPRTWGRPAIRILSPVDVRFIPTHVGQTTLSLLFYRAKSVHPHARGADVAFPGAT